MEFLIYVLAGSLGGILGGMGMGGGTVLIPILTIFFGVMQHSAQAINLIAFIPMAIVSIIIHFKNKMLEFSDLLLIIVPGVLSCILGCFIAKSVSGELLKRFFGAFLVVLSVMQVIIFFRNENSKKSTK